jgi:hypothetical protein
MCCNKEEREKERTSMLRKERRRFGRGERKRASMPRREKERASMPGREKERFGKASMLRRKREGGSTKLQHQGEKET